jgi:serine/threonine protein phosphatase 1
MFFTLPKNTQGRDFIAGDLHGCIKDLTALLQHVDFDNENDRLFLVGDLVDRGPNSMECLRLLKAPYVYAVQGNHEDMLAGAIIPEEGTRPGVAEFLRRMYMWNGGGWVWEDGNYMNHRWNPDLDPRELQTLAQVARDLPYVITVEDSFSVMHAEPPKYFNFTYEKGRDLLDYSQGGWADQTCQDGPVALWGRDWFYDFHGRHPANVRSQPTPRSSVIETMYVGHTPVQQPVRLGFLVNLDTGAGKKGFLTLHCHTTGETFSYVNGQVVSNEIYVYRNES